MKLLFDENLSPKLPGLLAPLFTGSVHVRDCGLRGKPDDIIWGYARDRGFTIVSKDSDFHHRSLLYGHPPKVVWLRVGNCNRQYLVHLLATHEPQIRELEVGPFESILIIG